MTFDRVCAVLVREPFNYTVAQIADLTPYQVRWILLRDPERDDLRGGKKRGSSYKDVFWKVWKEWRGKSEEEVQKLWDGHQKERGKGKDRKGRPKG